MNSSSTFAANDGDGYELAMGRWSQRLAKPFLDFAGTRDGERVLDVGCGTGHLARAIVERSMPGEVRAIDLAAAYIEHARRGPPDPRVVFEVGDAFADYWAPYDGREGPTAEYVAGLDEAGRSRLIDAVRAAYLDGEPDGPRSYAALAWAVKGIAPG